MPFPSRLRSFLRRFLHRRRAEGELDAELRSCVDLLADEKRAHGLDPGSAERAAKIELGGIEQIKEEVRGARAGASIEALWLDLRYGARMLSHAPGFAAVAILTLALGIGANTAIFSIVDAALLRPLPFRHSGQLVVLFTHDRQHERNWVSYPDFQDWRHGSRLFSALSAWVPQSVNFTGRGEPRRVIGAFVSANFFSMLGAKPLLGRDFTAGDDKPGASAHVAIVSYGMWKTLLGGDSRVLGRTLELNGQTFTVIGVMASGFHFPLTDAQVWIPFPFYPNFSRRRDRTALAAIGRIRDGVGFEEAQVEMDTIASRLAREYPATNAGRQILLERLHDVQVEDLRPQLLVLWGVVGLVLLIACANVANLLLARAAGRAREMALRTALGAGRTRLLRQLLTETMLLWLCGGALGVLGAYWGAAALGSQLAPDTTRVGGVDPVALGFTLGVSVLTGLLFGLVPALSLSNTRLDETLKDGGRTVNVAGGAKVRRALVVMQVALALILLAGAGLLLRSLERVLAVSPGFQPDHLLTMEYRLPRDKYPRPFQQWNFHQKVIEQVSAVPGVQSAAVIMALPFSGNRRNVPMQLLDRPSPAPGQEPMTQMNLVSPGLFRTMKIPLLRGRVITGQDSARRPFVAVINHWMANQFWPDGDPIGKRIRVEMGTRSKDVTATIIGVVGDVKQVSLEDPAQSQVYLPYAQVPFIFATLAVKTQGEPMALAKPVERAVWSVDAEQPVWKVRTLASLVDRSLGERRLVVSLLSGFALLVLLLAALGVYGVMAYAVNQRQHEIGIRMALGAGRHDVWKLIVGQGAALALLGVAIGMAGALAATRLMRSLLFGVSASDPPTFVAVAILLLLLALVACGIPALKATRVTPASLLRYQ